jgi:ABC-type cobalamin transport system ATPase subunit
LKDLLLNEQDFQSSQSMILLDIFLNLCNANKGRLPLIERHDLKNILAHTSEIKGAKVAEMRLMVRNRKVNLEHNLITAYFLDFQAATAGVSIWIDCR